MNFVLLSGGSGRRLWPLSNDVRSKQFIKIFRREDGTYESMVQRVYRQIRKADPDARILVATGKAQVSSLHSQLGEDVEVSVEPCRRDTFPAITLAAAYLRDVLGAGEEETVVVCPVDPLADDGYFTALKELGELAAERESGLVLMGIKPYYPSEKYGYILPKTTERVSRVATFREKPDAETAKGYIARGALWNGGVFACRIGYLLERARMLSGFTDHRDYYARYGTLEKISFDYAVVEKEPDIRVVRFDGMWKDMGTWNTLTEAMDGPAVGNVRMDGTCSNTHVINELDIPVLAMGLKDVVISASPEGILVADKDRSSYIKPYVDRIEQPVMFADKSWGTYRVLEVSEGSLTIQVSLGAGHHMNYHSHQKRDEVWVVTSGQGRTVVDGMEQEIRPGDVVAMQAGCRHTVFAVTDLKMIEIQLGKDISVHDKQKFELETWEHGRPGI